MQELRIARAKAGMTLMELEAASGVGASTISKIERGVTHPQAGTLHKLADALGVEVDELYPKAQAPLFQESPEQKPAEERRADVKGPDESVWGAPQNRPGPSEQIPESAGDRIHVEIGENRVTITRTAFLDVLREHGLTKRAAEETIEELLRRQSA